MDNYSLRPLTAPMAAKAETAVGHPRRPRQHRRRRRRAAALHPRRRLPGERPAGGAARSGRTPRASPASSRSCGPTSRCATAASLPRAIYDSRRDIGCASAPASTTSAPASARPTASLSGRTCRREQLYETYYGAGGDDWSHDDVGGLVRYEHRLETGLTLFAGLSRSVRPADATERFLASNSGTPAGALGGQSRSRRLEAPPARPRRQLSGSAAADLRRRLLRPGRRLHPPRPRPRPAGHPARRRRVDLPQRRRRAHRRRGRRLAGARASTSRCWQRRLGPRRQHHRRPPDRTDPAALRAVCGSTSSAALAGARRPCATPSRRRGSTTTRPPAAASTSARPPATPSSIFSAAPKSGLRIQVGVDNLFDELFSNHLNRANSSTPSRCGSTSRGGPSG